MQTAVSPVASAHACGAVVLAADQHFVVLGADETSPIGVPIMHHKMPLHRADCLVSARADRTAMGLPDGHFLVRTHLVQRIRPAMRLGGCPPAFLAALIARQKRAFHDEQKEGCPSIACRQPDAAVISHGRRIGGPC